MCDGWNTDCVELRSIGAWGMSRKPTKNDLQLMEAILETMGRDLAERRWTNEHVSGFNDFMEIKSGYDGNA